jgi:hypothetical protein
MNTRAKFILALLGLLLAASAQAGDLDMPRWPDTRLGRLETLALIEQLNGELLASRSATTTLEDWCGGHHMASPPRMIAVQQTGAAREATAEDRAALGVSATRAPALSPCPAQLRRPRPFRRRELVRAVAAHAGNEPRTRNDG